jgi:hypothetical protein
MARENQGIHIALIISVMFAVVFAVTTWYFYKQSTEVEAKLKTESTAKVDAQAAAEKANTDAKEMAKLIAGPGASGKLDDAMNQAKKDLQIPGAGLKPEELFYSPCVIKLTRILADKNDELKKKNEEIAKWDVKYKEREASKDPQIKDFREASEKAGQELAAAKQNFDTRRAEVEKLAAATQEKLTAVRKDLTTEIEKQKEDNKKLEKSLATTQTSLEQKTTVIDDLKRTIVDIPDGEVRWVNQRTGLVWINVGRADGLQPLMTFSIFPADISDLSKGARKGSVEVTQILGDHMAEARITDDSITDPIMPGDKIDTALWNPGEQLHFALAGLMDVNGDNRNDLELVKNLITMNNGVVDSYEDDQGHVHGLSDMSINTRYLVLGNEQKKIDAKTSSLITGQTTMIDKAKELGVQNISLHELLQRMGYKPPVSTRATGVETKSNKSFTPKPGSTEARSKTNDAFQPRQVP